MHFPSLSLLVLALIAVTHAAGPVDSGTFSITVNGKKETVPVFSLGSQQPSGNSWVVPYNTRGYLGRSGYTFNQGTFKDNFYVMPLLGQVLTYTIDMTNVAAGCNAALYTVTMPASGPSKDNDWYCDANQVGGIWCAEMDLIEANVLATQFTPHKCDSAAGPCDKSGCATNSRTDGGWFCSGCKIDPKKGPFTQSFEFVGSGNQVTDIVVITTQGSNTQKNNLSKCGASYLSAMINDFKNGMVLVASYWGSKNGGMSWLDGDKAASCPGSGSFTVSNITLGAPGQQPVDPCSPNPCLNGGQCNDGVCKCTGSWTGDKCDKAVVSDPCSSSPCKNGGTCSGGTCTCPPNWTGDRTCSTATPATDLCSPNPCKNSGTCNKSTGKCTCSTGWTGDNCTTSAANPCSPNPCKNGGTCNKSTGRCTCPSAFMGDSNCATATPSTDPCAANPCQNDGVCQDDGTCQCAGSFAGADCSEPIPADCTKDCNGHGACYFSGEVMKCQCSGGWSGVSCTSKPATPENPCEACPDTCEQDADGNVFCPSAPSDENAKSADSSSGSSTLLVVVIVLAVLVVLGIIGCVIYTSMKPSGPAGQFMKQGTTDYYGQPTTAPAQM